MPWPTDPIRRAEAAERHRASQQKRWENQEAREIARKKANEHWTPEKRAEMSRLKLAWWKGNDEARENLSILRASPSVAERLAAFRKAKNDARRARRELIKQRAVVVAGAGI